MAIEPAEVHAYCDGASGGQRDTPGGWGIVLIHLKSQKRKELCGHLTSTSNHRAELVAALQVMLAIHTPVNTEVFSDSENACNTVNTWMWSWKKNGWRKRDGNEPAHLDVIQQLYEQAMRFRRENAYVHFTWVKGHAGHVENERCDELAVWAKEHPNELLV